MAAAAVGHARPAPAYSTAAARPGPACRFSPRANVIDPVITIFPFTRPVPVSNPIRLRSRLTTASITTTSPGWTGRRYRTRSMPMKRMSRSRFSGFARMRMAPTCPTASVRMVGGREGRCPGVVVRKYSSAAMFLMPTIRRSGSISTMRSTSRKGKRCGRIRSIAAVSRGRERSIVCQYNPVLEPAGRATAVGRHGRPAVGAH